MEVSVEGTSAPRLAGYLERQAVNPVGLYPSTSWLPTESNRELRTFKPARFHLR